jgi:hypothetical protein
MTFTPVKRLIRSALTLERSDVLLHGQCGFGSAIELNPFLLLEDPHDDILSWTTPSLREEADSESISKVRRPGN